jgi:large repetitive protein
MKKVLLLLLVSFGLFFKIELQAQCNGGMTVTILGSGAGLPLSSTITSTTEVLCFGNNTGEVIVEAAGGTSPYQFSIDGGVNFQATGVFSGLVAGAYTVSAKDANNCMIDIALNITQPAAGLAASIVGTNVLCYGNATGAANISVTGGTLPYSYEWSNGATTEDLTNLVAGTYDVVVTDNNGCSISSSVVIAQPAAGLAATITKTDVLCFGNSTGAADLAVTGGTAPYVYVWSNGATSEDLNGLVAGTYDVTITDNNACTFGTSVVIAQPNAALAASIAGTNVLCYGNATGAANLTVTGGTSPYVYAWTNGAFTQDLTSLVAGTYGVTVTDNNGCSIVSSIVITQPAAGLAAAISGTNVLCFGNSTGAADLNVNGGTAPYTYIWSNSATTQDLTDLSSGIYEVTITDNNACTVSAAIVITQPAASLTASAVGTNVLCFGNSTGAADLTVAGGTAPYVYNWSNGANSQDLVSLTAGTYSVVVTDNNGCTIGTSVIITQPTAALAGNIVGTNVLCFNNSTGAANLTVVGGTAPYTYAWSNNETTQDLTSLAAGTYMVTVTDNNSCTIGLSVSITQPAAGLAITSVVSTSVSCVVGQGTSNNGTVTVAASGGTGALQYSIDGGVNFQNNGSFTGLTAMVYNLVIKDANDCQTTGIATVSAPTPITAGTCSAENDLCQLNAGQIKIEAAGGTGTLNVTWTATPIAPFTGTPTGMPSGSAQPIPATGFIIYSGLSGNSTYNFVLTDANGCHIP